MKAHHIPNVGMEQFRAGGERRTTFCKEFGDALRTFGFVRVTGHGLADQMLRDMHRSARAVFAKPPERLMPYHHPDLHCQRGYIPPRVETAAGYTVPDEKSMWHVGRPSLLANVWPPTEFSPNFELNAMSLFSTLDQLFRELTLAVEIYLSLPAGTLTSLVNGPNNSLLRIAYYPQFEGTELKGSLRSQAHKDINLLTLLPAATASGLEVQTVDGQWIPIRAEMSEVVVDTGLMLERVTNGYLPATVHRVVNPGGEVENTDRYSFPFFGHPIMTSILQVPERFTGDGFPPPPPPVTALEALEEVLKAIGLKT